MSKLLLLKSCVNVAIFFLLLVPFSASAAVLYIDPDAGTVSPDHMFAVNIRVDEQGQCLNVFDVTLRYPTDSVEAVTVSRGRSIMSLWAEEPTVDKGKGEVSFVGGIPGGYCGRVPGDPNLTNVLVTVVFQPKNRGISAEEVAISFDRSSSVILSDGSGTLADTEFIDAVYEVGDVATVHAEEWLDIQREDDRPPLPFKIELLKDGSLPEDRYYIFFSTTDKGSGLSYYEVKEEDIDREGFIRGSDKEARFERANSPYVLKDQTLNSVISVRAVDSAGNERIERLIPDESMRETTGVWSDFIGAASGKVGLYATFLTILLVLVVSLYIYFGRRKRKTELKSEVVHNIDDNDVHKDRYL